MTPWKTLGASGVTTNATLQGGYGVYVVEDIVCRTVTLYSIASM